MKRINTLFIVLLAAICMTAIAKNEKKDEVKKNDAYAVARNLEIFSSIYKHLDMMYVDTLDADVTVGEAIDAMLRSLDPYTEYYPPEEVKNLKTMLTGKYAGIGALIKHNMKTDRVIVDEPYENMPAATAGLKKGDIILAIDDSVMVGKTVSYVSSHLRGEPGTTFKLTVKRPTPTYALTSPAADKKKKKNEKSKYNDDTEGEILNFKITRQAIQMPCVPYYGMLKTPDSLQSNEKIGYLMLSQFTDNCARDVRRALVEMRQQGMTSLVFDLRGNGGGSLSEAIKIVNMFVPKGVTLVTTKGKIKRSNREYKTDSEPLDTIMPIVVLVNGNTASASEITSGSLQDLDRAVIMGTRTFGKGLVQQPVELPHDASLKVTVSKYHIPSGRCIQAINYRHTGGGYRENIADSLTHVFKTRNGRIVHDGGGIKPDITVKPDSLPNIAAYLCQGGLDSTEVALYYVTDYIASHPTIAPADEFRLTDAEYADFKQRVIDAGFKYDRETNKLYDELVQMAKLEGYYDDAKTEFDALKAKLKHNLTRELDNNRAIISHMLEQSIVSAYYYQKGGIMCTFDYDPQLQRAIRLLTDSEAYRKVLSPAE